MTGPYLPGTKAGQKERRFICPETWALTRWFRDWTPPQAASPLAGTSPDGAKVCYLWATCAVTGRVQKGLRLPY